MYLLAWANKTDGKNKNINTRLVFMPHNPFLNTRLVNLPLGQPAQGGTPLGVPIVGQGYDPGLFFFFNNRPRNLGLGGVGGVFPTFSWDQTIIDRAANNPPLGFQTALVTFSASQARDFLNPDGSPKAGYDVRRFCSIVLKRS